MKLPTVARGAAITGTTIASVAFFQDSLGLAAVTLLALFCLSTTDVVSLRNIVVAYLYLLFGIGPYLIPMTNRDSVQWLACCLFGAFAAGVGMRRLTSTWRPREIRADEAAPMDALETSPFSSLKRKAPRLLLFSAIAQIILVILTLAQYGLSGYLGGASLAGKISGYVENGGLDAIGMFSVLAGVLTAACVGAYADEEEPDRRYTWRWLIAVLVVFPLMRLDRSSLIVGVIGLLFFAARQRALRSGPALARFSVISATVLIAVVSAFGIGMLRSEVVSDPSSADSGPLSLIVGEVSPVRVVSDAILPGAPRYGGAPILGPMVTRYIPRRVFPDKPENTTTLYMLARDPETYRHGYMLAPSAFGTIILNFGSEVAIGVSFAMGSVLAARNNLRTMSSGTLAILFLSVYPIMRNDLANSVPALGLALLLYAIIRPKRTRHGTYAERKVYGRTEEVAWAAR